MFRDLDDGARRKFYGGKTENWRAFYRKARTKLSWPMIGELDWLLYTLRLKSPLCNIFS